MSTASFDCGRTTGALGLSLSAMSCSANVPRSLGACSPSSSSQSKPASPTISAVTGLVSDTQQPIRRLPARRSRLNAFGMAEYGAVIVGLRSANEARALRVERPAGNQVLHRGRIVTRAESHAAVERVRPLHLHHVELDTEPRTVRH